MTALIIDTSTSSALVALSKNGKVAFYKNIPAPGRLSKSFLPTLNSLLNEFSINLQELNYISVGIGPGSYTGTRVGVVIAQTLCFALGIPLVTFCSFKAFMPVTPGAFAYVMPAKSKDFYLFKGVKIEEGLQEGFYHSLIPPEALATHLEEAEYVISSEIELIPQSNREAKYVKGELNVEALSKITYNKFLNEAFSSAARADLLYLH